MSHRYFYVKCAIAIAFCATAAYLAAVRGAAAGPVLDAHARGDQAAAPGLVPGVGKQSLPSPKRLGENDENPVDVVALRRAILARAESAQAPTDDPMAQARKTLDERMSSAPTNARETARMEQMLRSVVDSGILGDTVATFTCGGAMCKLELMNSDNGRVETSVGALVEGVAKNFAATVIYPEGTGKRAMYLAMNSGDLSLGPPPGPVEHVFTKTAVEENE